MTQYSRSSPSGVVTGMKMVTFKDYLGYIEERREVEIEGSIIELKPVKIKRLIPSPEELTDITTTVWSFPKRGAWATHRGNYRGNWAPQIPRALILMYTEPGDTVLDPMIGSGTTCIEAKLLGRNCIGVDINYNAVILTLHRLYWLEKYLREASSRKDSQGWLDGKISPDIDENISIDDVLNARVEIYHGDARSLDKIRSESIDLIATHPPYYNIIKYGKKAKLPGDLSGTRKLEEYLSMMYQVTSEAYRVLKPGKYMGLLAGDTRIRKHYVPITHYILEILLRTGFILKEEVIKIQHRMKTTRERWAKLKKRDFLLIYHEKLFIARKPGSSSEYRKYKYSSHLDLEEILPGKTIDQ